MARVDRQKVTALLLEGQGRAEVAKAAGCSPTAVNNIRRELQASGKMPSSSGSPIASRNHQGAPPARDLQDETAALLARSDYLNAQQSLEDTQRRIDRERRAQRKQEREERLEEEASIAAEEEEERQRLAELQRVWLSVCARAGVSRGCYAMPTDEGHWLFAHMESLAQRREAEAERCAEVSRQLQAMTIESTHRYRQASAAAATQRPVVADSVRRLRCLSCDEVSYVEGRAPVLTCDCGGFLC